MSPSDSGVISPSFPTNLRVTGMKASRISSYASSVEASASCRSVYSVCSGLGCRLSTPALDLFGVLAAEAALDGPAHILVAIHALARRAHS